MKGEKIYLQEYCSFGGWNTLKKYSTSDYICAKKHCLNRGIQKKKTNKSYKTRLALKRNKNFIRIFPDNPEFKESLSFIK